MSQTSTNVALYELDMGKRTAIPLFSGPLLKPREEQGVSSEPVTMSSIALQTPGSVSEHDSEDPLSPGESHSVSSTAMAGILTEVENLQRVVEEMWAERSEPPPEYVE